MNKLLMRVAAVVNMSLAIIAGGAMGQTDGTPSVRPCRVGQVSGRPTLRQRSSTPQNSTAGPDAAIQQALEKENCPPDAEDESREVKRKPAVRFEGLTTVDESDLLKQFHERGVQLPKDPTVEPHLVEKACEAIKEFLASRGFRHATVSARIEQSNADPKVLVFLIDEGPRPRIAEFRFEGNRVFSSQELAEQARQCLTHYERDFYDPEVFDYCLFRLNNNARSRGFLQARLHDPRVEDNGADVIVTIQVDEGVLYRLGNVEIEGASAFSLRKVRSMLTLKTGDAVNGEQLSKWLFEDLKKLYGQDGYIQYTAEVTPQFRLTPDGSEGVADFEITIDEGRRFKVSHINFVGIDISENQLPELLVHDGDIYNQTAFEKSIDKLNDTGLFELIDKDKDVDYHTNAEEGFVDIVIKLKKRS